jgi:hypothetical protein
MNKTRNLTFNMKKGQSFGRNIEKKYDNADHIYHNVFILPSLTINLATDFAIQVPNLAAIPE